MSIDWNKETEKVNEGVRTYFKPDEADYNIIITSEGVNAVYEDKETGEITPQVEFDVDVKLKDENKETNPRRFVWAVSKAYGSNSLYAQLVKLIEANNNNPVGLSFELRVTGVGKQRRYSIPAARKLFKGE